MWAFYPYAVGYTNANMLPGKERFVKCFTNRCLHFNNQTLDVYYQFFYFYLFTFVGAYIQYSLIAFMYPLSKIEK